MIYANQILSLFDDYFQNYGITNKYFLTQNFLIFNQIFVISSEIQSLTGFPVLTLNQFSSIFIYRNRTQTMNKSASLPTIKDMYNCTRQNFDYNVIKHYEGKQKSFAMNTKPTKKDHYLDQSIKLNCSPGPANAANSQSVWFKKSNFQSKRAPKETYLDLIYKREKKLNSPSSNHYNIAMPWPKKKQQIKYIGQKTNFADDCQYESNKIPGPGTYNVRTSIASPKNKRKWQPHSPIQPRATLNAQNGNYNPLPQSYKTFASYELLKNSIHHALPKKSPQKKDQSKQNQFPGPGTYSTISFWPGKSPLKKNQINYFSITSKAPSFGVYH